MFFRAGLHHLFHSLGEHTGHVLRFAFGFNGPFDHLVAFFDGLVQVFEDLHVGDVPVVAGFHFGDGQAKVVVQLFCDAEDLAQTVFFTGVLLLHLVEFRLKVLNSLR